MSNLDTLANHLRVGRFLLVQDKAGTWLLGSARHPTAFEKVVEDAKIPFKDAFILIGEMQHLYEYVLKFSELAWDIAEGSEKALLIWYDHPKDVSAKLLDVEGHIGVMLSRCKTLDPILKKIGHGLFCLLLPPSEQGLPALPDVLPLPLEVGCRLAPERIMRLGSEGDVKFLKY